MTIDLLNNVFAGGNAAGDKVTQADFDDNNNDPLARRVTSADGRFVFPVHDGEIPLRVDRLELTTGAQRAISASMNALNSAGEVPIGSFATPAARCLSPRITWMKRNAALMLGSSIADVCLRRLRRAPDPLEREARRRRRPAWSTSTTAI